MLRQAGRLRGDPALARLLIKLIEAPEVQEDDAGELLEELANLPAADLLVVASELRAAAKQCATRQFLVDEDLLEILTAAGLWDIAVDIARDATALLSDTTWDRPRKLRSVACELAVGMEAAVASSDRKRAVDSRVVGRRWRSRIRQDDETYKKKKKGRSIRSTRYGSGRVRLC